MRDHWDELPPGEKAKLGEELREYGLSIITDTREQKAFDFSAYGVIATRQALETGDYSLGGYEDQIAVERKSAEDLLHCVGTDRDRFKRELVRLSQFRHKAVIVESPLAACYGISDITPSSLVGSIATWHIRYGVPFLFCMCRAEAEALTFRLLRAAAIELCRERRRIRIKWLDERQWQRWTRKCEREEAAAAPLGSK